MANWVDEAKELEEDLSSYEKAARETKWSNERIVREMGLESPDMASSAEYKRRYGAPYRCTYSYTHEHARMHICMCMCMYIDTEDQNAPLTLSFQAHQLATGGRAGYVCGRCARRGGRCSSAGQAWV